MRWKEVSIGIASCAWLLVSLPPRKRPRVSLWEATHCNSARALQTRFDAAAVSCDGFKSG